MALSFSSKGRVLTDPVTTDTLCQGHSLKEDVPPQRTRDTCRDPYLQKPLGASPGPFDPEADASSKPFVLSASVVYKGANSANLECQPVDHQGPRPRKKVVSLNTAFPNMSFDYLFGKKVTFNCIKNTVVLNSFLKRDTSEHQDTLELIRISR